MKCSSICQFPEDHAIGHEQNVGLFCPILSGGVAQLTVATLHDEDDGVAPLIIADVR
jgi:hypothetical protein